jgi:hypothetical protein
MAFFIILSVLVVTAALTGRFTPEDREYRGLSFPPEWPRLPELPQTAYARHPQPMGARS